MEGGVLDDCHTPLAVTLIERHGRLLVGLQASKTGLAFRSIPSNGNTILLPLPIILCPRTSIAPDTTANEAHRN